ncbi:ABC transporter ATP-binding protein [Rhodopseudomonas palustris]|nr:ATP-binding cassette domain-containing protein [Rhodopseudomonas palustris]
MERLIPCNTGWFRCISYYITLVDDRKKPMRNDVTKAHGGTLRVAVRMRLDGPAGPFDLDVDLSIAAGSLVAIVGPSGAGKTTLLRVVAGLARPQHAQIHLGSTPWCDTESRVELPTRRRSIGFVFQDFALFPNMTVRGNVDYALGARGGAGDADRLLDLVGLSGLAGMPPTRLSGGQKQRLALIRALARRPAVLMLDEPLSALDPAMRRKLQDDLRELHARFGATTLLVSHDAAEILRLADRVIRLDHGKVAFDGAPAAAFGAAEPEDGLTMIGEYLGGRDAHGTCMVRIDGRARRLRLSGDGVTSLQPGDTVMLYADRAAIRPAAIRSDGTPPDAKRASLRG